VHSLYKFSAVEPSQIGLYNGNTLRSLRYELRIYVKRELILFFEGFKLLLNVCCMQYMPVLFQHSFRICGPRNIKYNLYFAFKFAYKISQILSRVIFFVSRIKLSLEHQIVRLH